MTIDERLEKLTERHEALTQTVELIAGMQLQTEKAMTALARAQTALAKAQARTEKGMAAMQDAIRRLTRTADNHKKRLRRLEGK